MPRLKGPAAAFEPGLAHLIYAADPGFLAPGEMTSRIAKACRRVDSDAPQSPPAFVRTILDILALAHAQAVCDAAEVPVPASRWCIWRGARNALLCQHTADACGLPVVGGPVEADALGNALVQAHTIGAVRGGLPELRALVAAKLPLLHYDPPPIRPPGAPRKPD